MSVPGVGVLRWLPAVLATAGIAFLASQLTSWGDVVWYMVVFAWSVLLPGMLAFRGLRGRPTTLLADVAFGGGTGLALQLVAWAAFTAVGIPQFLLAWPLLVVVPCALVPRLRRVWSVAPYERRLNPATSLVIAAVSVWSVRDPLRVASASPVPPEAGAWYQDLYWHLSLVGEMKRAVLPTDPQVAGEAFSYHWFADAHVAAMTWSTGLDTPLVFTRLWLLPIIVLTVLALAAVGQHLTGRAWPGALAAAMAIIGVRVQATYYSYFGGSAFTALSPSQEFSGPFLLLALVPLIDIFRGRRLRWGSWTLLVLGLLGASGAKASTLPVLVCGVALAALVAAIANRKLLRGALGGLAAVIACLAVTWPLVSGGGGGSGIQIFSTVRSLTPWSTFAGSPMSLGILPPGIDKPGAWTLLAVVMIGWLVFFSWTLLGLPTLGRRDLSGWALLGSGIAGFAAMLLVNQDGLSQVYFMSTALLCGYLFASWGYSLLVRRAAAIAPWTTIGLTIGGIAVGLAAGLSVRSFVRPITKASGLSHGIALSLAPWAAAFAVWIVAMLVVRTRVRASAMVALAGASILLGASLTPVVGSIALPIVATTAVVVLVSAGALALGVVRYGRGRPSPRAYGALVVGAASLIALTVGVVHPVASSQPSPSDSSRLVTSAESGAALWLRAHSRPTDIVATNVHCLGRTTRPNCDARAFWVGAFTERPVYIGGWAYTSAAREMHGQGGRSYKLQPFHDPARFAANEVVFSNPTAADVARLRSAGVRFVYADSLASPVSPRLAAVATLVHREGTVSIYEL